MKKITLNFFEDEVIHLAINNCGLQSSLKESFLWKQIFLFVNKRTHCFLFHWICGVLSVNYNSEQYNNNVIELEAITSK